MRAREGPAPWTCLRASTTDLDPGARSSMNALSMAASCSRKLPARHVALLKTSSMTRRRAYVFFCCAQIFARACNVWVPMNAIDPRGNVPAGVESTDPRMTRAMTEWLAPHETLNTPQSDPDSMLVGVKQVLTRGPRESCPCSLDPKPNSLPLCMRTRVWLFPQEAWRACFPRNDRINTGRSTVWKGCLPGTAAP